MKLQKKKIWTKPSFDQEESGIIRTGTMITFPESTTPPYTTAS